MNETRLTALDATDPMGYLAALGVLRVVASKQPDARLGWFRDGSLFPALHTAKPVDVVELLYLDVERWRNGHPAVDFAVGGDQKTQDLKHPPNEFRALMRMLARDPEGSAFVAAYGTGVAVDGSGQTKPTALHFTAGKQRFMDAILSLRSEVTRDDLTEALFGPWIDREGKDPRWRAASERSRALLSFNPGKAKTRTVAGAAWLAYQSMPLFPVVPVGRRARTTAFGGRGKNEWFVWPVWSEPLSLEEVRVLVGLGGLERMDETERRARGIATVLRSNVLRRAQGYGNFSAAEPV